MFTGLCSCLIISSFICMGPYYLQDGTERILIKKSYMHSLSYPVFYLFTFAIILSMRDVAKRILLQVMSHF
jgi:hypothetical protein